MSRAGAVWLDVIPSMAGFNRAVETGARARFGSIGKASGAEWSTAFTGSAKQGMAGFRAAVEAETAAAAREVTAASAKVAAARKREADAAGQVRVAETKLQEVRAKGNATASQTAVAEERLAKAQRDLGVASGSTAAREGELTVAEKAQGDAAAVASEKTATAGLRMREFGASAQSGFGKAATAAKGASKVMLGFAAFGVADFAYHSLKAAGDFQASMNLLVTAGGESKQALNLVAAGVKSIAVQTGTATHDLAEGMYVLEKAGFRGSQGLLLLKAAAQGAKAENVDLGTMTNALTSIMRSYDLPASAAVRVTNQLVAASGAAKTTMQDFAGSLATVLPIASAAHISFAQVGGAIATLTSHGTSAQEATQELAFSIRNLQAPNHVAINMMAQFGLSSNDVSQKLGSRGLTGTIGLLSQTILHRMGPSGTALLNTFNASKVAAQDAATMMNHLPPAAKRLAQSFEAGKLSMKDWRAGIKFMSAPQAALASQWVTMENKAKGFNSELRGGGQPAMTYTAALKAMMGGAAGLNTALQLSGGSAANFRRNVAEVGKAGLNAGKDVSTWATTQKNFNVVMGQFKERIQVASIELGSRLIPALLGTFTWIGKNSGWLKPLVLTMGAAFVAVKLWAAGQWLLNAALTANPIGLVIAGVAALVVGLIYAYKHSETFRKIVDGAFRAVAVAFNRIRESVQATPAAFHAVVGAFHAVGAAISRFFARIGHDVSAFGHAIPVVFHRAVGAIAGFFARIGRDVSGAVGAVGRAFAGIGKAVGGALFDALKTVSGWALALDLLLVGAVVKVTAPFRAAFMFVYTVASDVIGLTLFILRKGLVYIGGLFVTSALGLRRVWDAVWKAIHDAVAPPLAYVRGLVTGAFAYLGSLFTAARVRLTAIWNALFGAVKSILTAAWSATRAYTSIAFGAVVGLFNSAKAKVLAVWNALFSTVKSILTAAWAFIRGTTSTGTGVVVGLFNSAKAKVLAVWNPLWGGVKKIAADAMSVARSGISTALGFIQGAFRTAVSIIGSVWNGLKAVARAPIAFIVNTVYTGGIKRVFDAVSDAVGYGKHLPVEHFATGGIVSGPTSKVDNRLVWARSGEGILVPEATQALGGARGIGALNRMFGGSGPGIKGGVPAFAGGGVLGSQGAPGSPKANSGGLGGALGGIASNILGAFTDPVGTFKRLLSGVIGKIGASPLAQLGGAAVHKLVDVLGGVLKHAASSILQSVGGGSSPVGGAVGGGAARWLPTVLQVLHMLGQSPAFAPGVLRRINFESGGNPNAINLTDSNARAGYPSQGLMQTIPQTFARWAGPFVSLGITNGLASIYAGSNYAIHRYGSLAAIDPLVRPMGYDSGGMLQPGLQMVYNGTGKPEPVLTDRQWNLEARQTAPAQGGDHFEFNVQTATFDEQALRRYERRRELTGRVGRPR